MGKSYVRIEDAKNFINKTEDMYIAALLLMLQDVEDDGKLMDSYIKYLQTIKLYLHNDLFDEWLTSNLKCNGVYKAFQKLRRKKENESN